MVTTKAKPNAKSSSDKSPPAKTSPKKASPMNPYKSKRTKVAGHGCIINKSNEVVWTIRLKAGVHVAFIVKGSNSGKGAYIQHLVNLARSNDETVMHLNISSIVPRRSSDGSNKPFIDGTYPMRQFLRILDSDEEDSLATIKKWGTAIATTMTNLNKTSTYPSTCVYGGDLTPSTGPPSVDTHVLDADTVQIARHLYGSAIDDGSFFEEVLENDEDVDHTLANMFFTKTADPRTLFALCHLKLLNNLAPSLFLSV